MRRHVESADDRPWSAADLALLTELVPLLRELEADPGTDRLAALKARVSALALDLHRSTIAINSKAAELGLPPGRLRPPKA